MARAPSGLRPLRSPPSEAPRRPLRADLTVQLSALDVLPGDGFDARLAQVDGQRFGATYVRGGRVISGAVPAIDRFGSAGPPARETSPARSGVFTSASLEGGGGPEPVARPAPSGGEPTASARFDSVLLGAPSPFGDPVLLRPPVQVSDAALLRTFRTDPISRVLNAVRRLFGIG